MNKINPPHAGTASHSAVLPQGDAWLCDRMDADNEWEWVQRRSAPEGCDHCPQLAQSFEFDIHDCSVSEVHR